MRETDDDVVELQRLLDESYANAGPHLLSIHTPNWRMSAEEVVERLQGMCILNLATVNSRGEPIVGPVDGIFYRGRFWCGSAKDSIRARHIRRRPQVSAAHTVGEELAVTVHGTAVEMDREAERSLGYRDLAAAIYSGEIWTGDVVYWEIEPRRMFAVAPKIDSIDHPPTA